MWAHGCTVAQRLRALHKHKDGVCAYVRNNRGVGTPVAAAVAGSRLWWHEMEGQLGSSYFTLKHFDNRFSSLEDVI